MKSTKKRHVDTVIISDVHLGTYGCHAKELHNYLKSINPKRLILNGDIIDVWQFSKRYFPKSHLKVVKYLMKLIAKGTEIYYVTGNHDEMLRRFDGFKLSNFELVNKVIIDLEDGQKAWIFHGDVFDVSMKYSKWLAKLGSVGYDTLILLNRFVNFVSEHIFKQGKLSFSKKIKDSVKTAVKFINDFEVTVADIAIMHGYDYVICGHIHEPKIREITTPEGAVKYLNSGDWVENLTALEYNHGKWSIYSYLQDPFRWQDEEDESEDILLDDKIIFNNLVHDFKLEQI